MAAQGHQNNKFKFALLLLVLQIIIIVMFGVFVRPRFHTLDAVNVNYYAMLQDVNVMILIGFGFQTAFIKKNLWSAVTYTFFINAIIVQLYLLLAPFWSRVFKGHWGQEITIVQRSFTGGSYSVAAVLISFQAIVGRVGPFELLIMGVIQIIGYTLNEKIIYQLVGVFDSGGSITIHLYGAFFGLTVSLILSKTVTPKVKIQKTYISNIFAIIGTLFLWMFWPSSNVGFVPLTTSPYQKSVIIMNTIVSLTGSCLGAFITTSFMRQKLFMQDILAATLAGGVVIGASCGLITNPAGSLTIGFFAGFICIMSHKYLQKRLQKSIGLYDTCGIINLHGIPSFLGGIFSAIIIASYATSPLNNIQRQSNLQFYNLQTTGVNIHGRTFYQQGGFQIIGVLISLGISIGFGLIAGFLMKMVYVFEQNEFYRDDIYFQVVQSDYNISQGQREPNNLQSEERI